MYCYNCRSIISNGMTKCPLCGASMDIISEVVIDNSLSELYKYCPELEHESQCFSIGVETITLQGDVLKISQINRFVNTLLRSSWKDLSTWMETNSFNTIKNKCDAKMVSILGIQSFLVAAFLKKAGLNITPELINQELMFFRLPPDILSYLNSLECGLNEISDDFKQLRKLNRREPSVTWMGGGFGLKSAIVGALGAQALNASTMVIHEALGALKEGTSQLATNLEVSHQKNIMKSSSEYRNFVFEEWRGHYLPLHWFMQEKLQICQEVKGQDSYSFPVIELPEIEENNDSLQSVLLCMSQTPLNLSLYARAYDLNNDLGADLLHLAKYCGIEDTVERLFVQRFNPESLTTFSIQEIGFGTSKEKLAKIKNNLDYINSNNPSALLKPEMIKYRDKVENTLMMKEISDASDKARDLLRNKPIKDSVMELIEAGSELEKDVFFTSYSNMYTKLFKDGNQKYLAWESELSSLPDDTYVNELLLIPFFRLQPPGFVSENLMKPIRSMAIDGSIQATAFYGMCLVNGRHMNKNVDLGIEMLKEAFKHNNHLALAQIGSFHRQGLYGFKKDFELAKKYLTYADLMGEKLAANELLKL